MSPISSHQSQGELKRRPWAMAAFLFLTFLLFCPGCGTTGKTQKPPLLNQNPTRESAGEVVSAVEAVVGAMSGQDVDSRDLKNVARQVQKDEQAKAAVEAIANSLSSVRSVKYCPMDGKRYDGHFEKCPEHGVLLLEIKE